MKRYFFAIVLVVMSAACGGRFETVEPDGGLSSPHGGPCTQSSCASSVKTVATLPFGAGLGSPATLFVGGGFIYTTDGAFIIRAPLSGGVTEQVGPTGDHTEPSAIVADDSNVYWATTAAVANAPTDVIQLSHAGSTPKTIGTSRGAYVFVDGSNLFWSDNATTVNAVVIQGGPTTAIPLTRTDYLAPLVLVDGELLGMDCTGVPTASTGAIVSGYGMVADNSRCYELHGDCGQPYNCGDIVSLPRGGGPMSVLVHAQTPSSQEFDSRRMMIDSEGFYLLRCDKMSNTEVCLEKTLIRVPAGGGSPVPITTDKLVAAYVVTADTIYWVAGDAIKAMPKYSP